MFASASSGGSSSILIVYIVIGLAIWSFFIRPRRKRREAEAEAFQLGQTNLATHAKTTTPTSMPADASVVGQSRIDALAKIGELRAKGILSEEEFLDQKRRILGS